jgi:uncharacterized membrane protein (UPF0127 family)
MRYPRALFLLAWVATLFITSACQGQPRVVVQTKPGREAIFQVEIADTPAKRELGLQYRRELASDQGMIFLFPAESEHAFWMKNTAVPLDMIYISRDRKIVGIVEQATPFTLDSRSVNGVSQYVLEINGGLAQKYGFKKGDSVRFENIPLDVRE